MFHGLPFIHQLTSRAAFQVAVTTYQNSTSEERSCYRPCSHPYSGSIIDDGAEGKVEHGRGSAADRYRSSSDDTYRTRRGRCIVISAVVDSGAGRQGQYRWRSHHVACLPDPCTTPSNVYNILRRGKRYRTQCENGVLRVRYACTDVQGCMRRSRSAYRKS